MSPGFNSSQFEYHGISPSLQFVCSGHVNAWEAYFESEGMYTNITFQVWRPQTTTSGCINTTYVLVGMNSFNNQTVDNTLRSQFVPAPNSVIEFKVGDVVGFYAKFDGSELAYFQTNSEASSVSYTIETSLTSLEMDGISTLNINCSSSISTVPLLTANVTQGKYVTIVSVYYSEGSPIASLNEVITCYQSVHASVTTHFVPTYIQYLRIEEGKN